MRYCTLLTVFALLIGGAFHTTAGAQGVPNSIGYQGELTTPAGQPVADGTYDVQFHLYNVDSGPNAPLWSSSPIQVNTSAGVFATAISGFPADIFADTVWLETVVEGQELAPRVQFASVPYALFAGNAWSLTGNAGTAPGTNFLGTTDDQPLEIRVNNHRAVRYQYASNTAVPTQEFRSINVIAGSEVNTIAPGVVGATIAGGGQDLFTRTDEINEIRADSDFAVIGGGYRNIVTGSRGGTLGGGYGNLVEADLSTISGGASNEATGLLSAVGGGASNRAYGPYSTVPGGDANQAEGEYSFAAGRRAAALHNGAFVWADSSSDAFVSTGEDQFLIDAGGGVGIGTNSPQVPLQVTHAEPVLILQDTDFPNVQSGYLGFWDRNNVETGWMGFGTPGSPHLSLVNARSGGNIALLNGAGGSATLLANGNVGIGTSTPNYKLTVAGDIEMGTGAGDYRHFRIGGGNSDGFLYGSFPKYGDGIHMGYNYYADSAGINRVINSGGQTSRVSVGYGYVSLATGGTSTPPIDRLFVSTSGNVGINTTSPTFRLHVNGSVAGVGAYNNLSDATLKRDIEKIDNALEKLKSLHGVSFDWKRAEHPGVDFPDGRQIGFLGQEVAQVLPECVTRDDKGYLSVAYGSVVPVLVEAIKEQQGQLDALKADNERLRAERGDIEALKKAVAALAEALRAQSAAAAHPSSR